MFQLVGRNPLSFLYLRIYVFAEEGYGARSDVVGSGTTLEVGRSWVREPMRSSFFFQLPDLYSRTSPSDLLSL
jgi:hypothetical protein